MNSSKRYKIILLPGLDGTGIMFKPIIPYLEIDFEPIVVSYPNYGPQSYSSLLPFVESILPKDEDYFLLAESFSGPLAVEIAAKNPKNLKALILGASFVTSPYCIPCAFRKLFSILVFKLPAFNFILKYFLLGFEADQNLISLMKNSLKEVDKKTLSTRLFSVFNVDVKSIINEIIVPFLFIIPSRDNLIPKSIYHSIEQLGIQTISIPGPHCLLQKEPEKSALHIKDFLNKII